MAGQSKGTRLTRALAATLAALIVSASLAPLVASSTGTPILTDAIGDNVNGGGGSSDIVALSGATNATHLHFYIEVAGADHPKLIQYRVNFTSGTTTYEAFTSYTTAGTFTSSFVGTEPITVTREGNEVHMAIERQDVGNPTHNTVFTAVTTTTRHGATGSYFDQTIAGSYRVNDHSPVLDAIGPKTVAEGATLAFTVTASDPDGDAITLSATGLPTGATFNATTGAFSWTPTFEQNASYSVRFEVSDGDAIDFENVLITVTNVNRAPVLAAIGNRTVSENQTLAFTVTASDPDGETPTLSATGLPTGATFNAATGAFSWTPTFEQAGSYDVTFTASDGSLSDSEVVTITVANANRAPVLAAIGERGVNENQTLQFTVSATDADGDALAFAAAPLPAGATFDAATRTFSWRPTFTQAGVYFVTFNVTDGAAVDSEVVRITVANVNRAPVLDPIGDRSVDENQLLYIDANATDLDNDVLTFGAAVLPSGATFDNATGVFRWIPAPHQAGQYTVTFNVTDGLAVDAETITILVGDVNRPPILDPIGNKTVYEEQRLDFNVTASDPDGDALTLSAAPLPAGATFNAATGRFVWTPTDTQAGVYDVVFTVRDAVFSDSETVRITVLNLNRAPVLAPIGDRTVDETQTLAFRLTATDQDNDPLTFSAIGLPAGATLDNATGQFSWTPTFTQSGTYAVEFRVSDELTFDSETITITVRNVNRPVTLDPIGNRTVAEAGTLEFNVTGTDPDPEGFSLSATGLPSGATFNATSGAFSWSPSTTSVGRYTVRFTATDETTSDFEDVVITVTEFAAPVLAPIGSRFVTEGAQVAFTVTATDADGDVLTFSATGVPAGATFDATTGAFSWTPGHAQVGSHAITFRVTDGNLSASESISIHVLEDNSAPTLQAIADRQIPEGSRLAFTATASDPDGDALTWSAVGLPAGATIDAATGAFSWTPDVTQLGTHAITIEVTDGSASDSKSFQVVVTHRPNMAITGPGAAINASGGEAVAVPFTVTNNALGADDVTFSLTLPAGWTAATPAASTFASGESRVVTILVTPGHNVAEGQVRLSLTTYLGATGSATATVRTPRFLEITFEETYGLDEQITGRAVMKYLNGQPASFSSVQVTEQSNVAGTPFSAARTSTFAAGANGVAEIPLKRATLGANAPGMHHVEAKIVGATNSGSTDSADYMVLPG